MAGDEKKPFAHLIPTILTGLAALIAALTTVYVNVRNDGKDRDAVPPTIVVAPVERHGADSAAPTPATPRRLKLERIAVEQDGSVGTTDWRFAVAVDGQPLFVFQQDGLDQTGGRNVVAPAGVGGMLPESAAASRRVTVQGWRGSRWRTAPSKPDVEGSVVFASTGALAPVAVRATRTEAGSFVFYFSLLPARDE